jgi:hypothetical protein
MGIFLRSHKTLRDCDSRSESGAFCAFLTVLFRPVADSVFEKHLLQQSYKTLETLSAAPLDCHLTFRFSPLLSEFPY